MEITIFDRLSSSAPEIKKALQKEKELFKKALENQYNFNKLKIIKITREEAIKVNLGDIKAINKVYFENIRTFTNFARCYYFNKTYGAKIYCAEDILQQIYVDLRYYDFTSNSTTQKCLNITCASSNNGGILNYLNYRSERKACFSFFKHPNANGIVKETVAPIIDATIIPLNAPSEEFFAT